MHQQTVPEMLQEAAETYEERGSVYGNSYLKLGYVLQALFPHGLAITNPDDWNRVGLLVQSMAKVCRYSEQWGRGGHPDSLLDISVYATMLREVDMMVGNGRLGDEPAPFDIPPLRQAKK